MYKILAVDDNKEVLLVLKNLLENNNYRPILCETGSEVLEKLKTDKPDLIILDLTLPDIDGLEICDQIRKKTSGSDIPIIMLTGRARTREKIEGLVMGSDDYVTKPFSPAELLARIKAVLRRTYMAENEKETIESGGITVNMDEHTIIADGKEVDLTKKEFELLVYFMQNEARIISKGELLEQIWGYTQHINTKTLDIHISRLRQKIGENAAKNIETVRGKGYRFYPV